MIFTKVADKLLNRVLPKVDASAATSAACGCRVRSATCESRRVVDYYYQSYTDYYGNCTIWGAFCYKRRTQEPC